MTELQNVADYKNLQAIATLLKLSNVSPEMKIALKREGDAISARIIAYATNNK